MSYRYLQPPVGERQPHSVRRACHAGRPTVSCGTGWTGRRAKPLAIALFPSKVQVRKRGSLVTIYRHQLELYSSIVERDVHLPSPNHHRVLSSFNTLVEFPEIGDPTNSSIFLWNDKRRTCPFRRSTFAQYSNFKQMF